MVKTKQSVAPVREVTAPHTQVRLRLERLCVALQASSPTELLARAEAALKEGHFFEFRLDSLPKPAAVLPALAQFLAANGGVTAIATCRRKVHGGGFSGSLSSELEILLKSAEAGCQIVDLELESAEEAKPAQLAAFRASLTAGRKAAPAPPPTARSKSAQSAPMSASEETERRPHALLISFHDYSQTVHLEKIAKRIEAFQPDFVKIVSTARSLADNLAILRLLEDRSAAHQIVAIAMGEEGIVSRILGPRAGGAFTFAAPVEGTATAPGQINARTLRELYRVDQLDAATRIFGVAGNPISHSLSPLMHNLAFRKEGINAVFLPLKARSLDDLLTLIRDLPLSGVAITMPLKCEVLPHLANMDPYTQRTGACNTLRTGADGKLYGFNTDVSGIVYPIEKRIKLAGARVAVLGAGGAARAAVFGLVDAGAEVFIVNRTHETAQALARKAKAKAMRPEKFARESFDVLINTTPCGMRGVKPSLPINKDSLNAKLVFDLVYNPIETPLIKLAQSLGIPTISGLEMFVQQGVRQFEIWTGRAAPEADMMRTVRHSLEEIK